MPGGAAVLPTALPAAAVPVMAHSAPPASWWRNAHGKAGLTVRAPFRVALDARGLQLLLGNWLWRKAGVQVGADDVMVRCALEWQGALHPLSIGGRTKAVSLAPGTEVVTDPLDIHVLRGQRVWLRVFAATKRVGQIPCGMSVNGTVGDQVAGSALLGGDATGAPVGELGDPTDDGRIPLLQAVLGTPVGPPPQVWLGVGDSITAGRGDAFGAPPGFDDIGLCRGGHLLRAVDGRHPVLLTAASGVTAEAVASPEVVERLSPLWAMATHAVVLLGTNDCLGTFARRTAVQVQRDVAAVWRAVARQGVQVFGSTITPYATSTDAWETVIGQAEPDQEGFAGRRTAVNSWIRAGAPLDPQTLDPVAVGTSGAVLSGGLNGHERAADPRHPCVGYVEVADAVESARDSARWLTNGTPRWLTVDGAHPSAAGAARMAAAYAHLV